MALFEVTAYDKKIYEEELRDFLPDKFIDIHTHLWCKEFAEDGNTRSKGVHKTVKWPSLVADTNPVEDLQEAYRLMFPGKEVSALCFTTRVPYEKNNAYVAEATARVGWAGLYYSDPMESGEELEREIKPEAGFFLNKIFEGPCKAQDEER